jgi:hypothetical protein
MYAVKPAPSSESELSSELLSSEADDIVQLIYRSPNVDLKTMKPMELE